MKKLLLIAIAASGLLTGCATANSNYAAKLSEDLKEFEKLGIKEVIITGKFSHTDYTVEHKDGKRIATVNHTNAWVPQIKVVRETPDEPNN